MECCLGIQTITNEAIQEFRRQRLDSSQRSCMVSNGALAKANHASVLLQAVVYGEAIRLQKEAINEYRATLGPDHSITMNCEEK